MANSERRVYVRIPFLITQSFQDSIIPLPLESFQNKMQEFMLRICYFIGIPKDADLYCTDSDYGNKFNYLYFSHESFDVVALGDATPPYLPSHRRGVWDDVMREFRYINKDKIAISPLGTILMED